MKIFDMFKFAARARRGAGAIGFLVLFAVGTGANAGTSYFRGKEDARYANPSVVVKRLEWASSPSALTEKDRLVGAISVDAKILDELHFIVFVFQSFNLKGDALRAFSAVPVKNPPKNVHKSGKGFQFYVDFPKGEDEFYLKLVNVLVDGNEVHYEIRMVENKIRRNLTGLADDDEAVNCECLDESESVGWFTPAVGVDKAKRTPNRPASAASPKNASAFATGQPRLDVKELIDSLKSIRRFTGLNNSEIDAFSGEIGKANQEAAATRHQLASATCAA